jgi:hypothetical protein
MRWPAFQDFAKFDTDELTELPVLSPYRLQWCGPSFAEKELEREFETALSEGPFRSSPVWESLQ